MALSNGRIDFFSLLRQEKNAMALFQPSLAWLDGKPVLIERASRHSSFVPLHGFALEPRLLPEELISGPFFLSSVSRYSNGWLYSRTAGWRCCPVILWKV